MKKPIPFGKYVLLDRINVGGMAEVFKAKAFGVEGFERLVAVKRILPNIAEDEDFITMFIDEAKIAVQLQHANVAQIFDLGKVEDSYFIALEYVSGKDLRAIFDRCRAQLGTPMPVAQACFVIMKVCEGLDYAHHKRDAAGKELGLVHRDVSPQNVLVAYEGEVKLIDFGIAKAASKSSNTQAGILKGKFGYMSPEQVRGLGLDRRSDIFSVGIILYELLTGERLFLGESDFSTLEKVRNVEILPPSTYNRKIPEELERIVFKVLSKDVEDRYANAIDLHDELQAFLYSSGEFYSRKDLSAWMKKFFAKEIDEETRQLEEYKHIQSPPRDTPAHGSPAVAPPRHVPSDGLRQPASRGEAPARSARPPSPQPRPDEAETHVYRDGEGSGAQAAPVALGPQPGASGAGTQSSMSAALPSPPPAAAPRSRSLLIAAGVVALALASGGAAAWVHARRPGTLSVGSEPADVRVFVDGVRQPGEATPLTVSLPAGEHVVRVERDGYEPAEQRVRVAAGGRHRLPLRLAPMLAAGFLVYSDPAGASITLDGRALDGATPIRVSAIAVGDHLVELRKPGYQPVRRRATAEAAAPVRLDFTLEPAASSADLRSRPPGAKVYLTFDGARHLMGKTPLAMKDLDAAKSYVVSLERSGCEQWSQPLRFEGGPVAIDAEMSCAGRSSAHPAGWAEAGGGGDGHRSGRGSDSAAQRGPGGSAGGVRKGGGAATARAPSAMGYLKINSKPWAKILIDGRDTGLTTPQLKLPLQAGQHRITLDNPSFNVSKTMNVEIVEGETLTKIEDLRNP
ncbi:MAG: PEGA domain-containing protein [Myxococcota bacterium]